MIIDVRFTSFVRNTNSKSQGLITSESFDDPISGDVEQIVGEMQSTWCVQSVIARRHDAINHRHRVQIERQHLFGFPERDVDLTAVEQGEVGWPRSAVKLAVLEHLAAVVDGADALNLVGHVTVTDHQQVARDALCMVRVDHIGRQLDRRPKATGRCVFQQES